jgi:hypothetical protein
LPDGELPLPGSGLALRGGGPAGRDGAVRDGAVRGDSVRGALAAGVISPAHIDAACTGGVWNGLACADWPRAGEVTLGTGWVAAWTG